MKSALILIALTALTWIVNFAQSQYIDLFPKDARRAQLNRAWKTTLKVVNVGIFVLYIAFILAMLLKPSPLTPARALLIAVAVNMVMVILLAWAQVYGNKAAQIGNKANRD